MYLQVPFMWVLFNSVIKMSWGEQDAITSAIKPSWGEQDAITIKAVQSNQSVTFVLILIRMNI